MKLFRIFAMSFALVLLALPVCAQLSNGTVKGVVTDPSGGSVPGAAVELINTGTNETRRVNVPVHAANPDELTFSSYSPGGSATKE